MKTRPLILLTSLVACGNESPAAGSSTAATSSAASNKSSAPSKPKAPPNPQTKLTASVDGQDVAMVTALAFVDGDRSASSGGTTVEVSSVPLTCADVQGSGRNIANGEVSFELGVGEYLQEDGKFTPALRTTSFSGMNQMVTTPTKTSGAVTEGSSFSVDVDFTIDSAGSPKKKLVAKGTIEARVCPPKKPSSEPKKLPEPMAATLEVGGKSLPIRSAGLIAKDGRVELTLSTGGDACPKSSNVVEGEFWSRVTFEGEKLREVSLRGGILPQTADQTIDPKKVVVKPTLAGPGTYELAIDASVVKYPLKASGKITAAACE
jgi:hypothetical protein